MACARCQKSIDEREPFIVLLNGVVYHEECFDRCLRARDHAEEQPPAEK